MSRIDTAAGMSVDEKRALLSRLARRATYPLSFAQERLWFLDQLTPGTPFYTIAWALPLRMPIDDALLERGVNALVARHESLRTTFPAIEGRPVQAIAPALHVPLRVHDLRHLPAPARLAEAQRLAGEEAQTPFDLAAGPLLRSTLVRLGYTDHVLLLTMHHIASDGWSLAIFGRELWACYSAYADGREPDLPELPIQYADFAVWQRERLQGELLDRQLAYWREQLAGVPALELPTDLPRPAVQTFAGATVPISVNSAVAARLRALGEREGCTLFMTLLAAFQALLARYSGQDDIVVGTYVAGRNRPETERMIGFFINTLVMRTNLGGDPTFRELMARVRDVALGAYANQDMPFPKLVETLQPERDLSRNPLFQVVFHLYNAPGAGAPVVGDGAAPPDIAGATGGAPFDLVVDMMEAAGRLEGRIQFNTDVFATATVERLARHFEALLAAVAANPDRGVWDLPLLTAAERRRLLLELNDTAVPYPSARLVELFAEQCAATPAAPAFTIGETTLTYAELDRRSSELAAELRGLGVGREVVVGVRHERSFELVVALLAIFKAGGAYLPLDPGLPAARLGFILEDARVGAVLGPGGIEARGPASPAGPGGGAPTDLAYVIYTSGSTGRPKGVAVEHAQLLNRLHWMWSAYPFEPGDVGCARTPPSFVDSLWELLGPLLRGVPTEILSDEQVRDPFALVDALGRAGASRIWLVPSLLRAVLDAHPDLQSRLPELRFWVTSGEALEPDLAARFRELMPDAVLYNLYGTSEAWDVTWYDPRGHEPPAWRVPIGRPIWNMRTYVLDRRVRPVPCGVIGDLYVGGIGLARGYLGRDELTAATFVPDPFSPEPGARMYRTGDLARRLPDGMLEYVGRADHQVKLRGFRIELGEVEAVLREHPGVRDAAAIVRRDGAAEPRLVAYAVPGDGGIPELRRFLAERLPGYMVPSTMVSLDALPHTASGKVDRLALPAPEAAAAPRRARAAPRTAAERVMAGIWADVLGVERIGVEDDFFADLGGHSLLGTQVISRARDAFQVELPLARLFETPTVDGLVSALLADPAAGHRIERTAQLLLDVAALSDQDVEAMLSARDAEAR